jgi:hypothetical protein
VIQAFIEGMSYWAKRESEEAWDLNAYPSAAIRKAIHSQTNIGWNRVIQGYIAREWQHLYGQVVTGNQESYQKNWKSTVYSAIFSFFCSSWKNRNEALHGRDQEESDNIMRTRLL